jgi:hypothetical protein
MLRVFRTTHPESINEPKGSDTDEAIDWYLRPRDPDADLTTTQLCRL